VNNVNELEILNFGRRNGKATETIDRLMSLGNLSIPVRIPYLSRKQHEEKGFFPESSSIMFFDSPKRFKRIQHWISFYESEGHLVYIHNASIKDLEVVSYHNETIYRTIFLVNETPHSISLATAFFLTPEACWKNQFKVINRYTRRQKRWENSDFFVEKFNTFHGCPLYFDDFIPDFDLPMYAIFGKELNFKFEYRKNLPDKNEVFFRYGYAGKKLVLSHSIYTTHIQTSRIYIPPGELYSDYEKMLLPFDTSIWIAIGLMIVTASLTILAIKLKPPEVQEVIFGEKNRSPFMNFISILLNGSQISKMTGNVPKILLMTMIFWSLIFR
jgi:hypothetical protein